MYQHSIFDDPEPLADPDFKAITRIPLGRLAWVDYLPNWVAGHDALFRDLSDRIDWHHHRRQMYERVVDVPRLTGSVPKPGRHQSGFVLSLGRMLSARYRRPLPSLSYAYYRDGQDSVAMHGDKVGNRLDDCVVAIVAVGEPRRFLLREVDGDGAQTFEVGWGDLLVMGGNAQRTWQHGIPKAVSRGPRISIMFRQGMA